MSTAADFLRRPQVRPPAASERATGPGGILGAPLAWAQRIGLEDWVTAGLLTVMYVAVAWAVQLSGWGDLPSLIPSILMAGAAGFWAARTRMRWYAAHALMLALGFIIVMWQGSIPADGANVADRARDAWERMFQWVQVARQGGISTDSVPFAVLMMAVTWVVAYIVSWTTFRLRNPWLPVLGLGVGLLTDLSYRQGRHEQTFFIFILGAVALFAHLTTVRRMAKWREAGMPFPANLRWLSVRDGLVLGVAVVAVAAALPVAEIKSKSLNDQWKVLRRPIENLREPATRLLSGVRGKDKRPPLAAPSDVLAFQGPIHLTDDPVMWVTSRYPILHAARVYQQYSSTGWLVGPRTVSAVPARAPSGILPPERSRERIEQEVQPLFDTSTVLPVGAVASVDRDTSVEILEPPRYVVPLTGAVPGMSEMPQDVRDLASRSRLAYFSIAADATDVQDRVNRMERSLSSLTTDDIESTLLVHPETGAPISIVLERPAPIEQVSVRLEDTVAANDSYTVTTYVSLATDEDLATAGEDYPKWVTDRYLQLPSSLPRRVHVLATEIVLRAGARTPFEKALAVAAFLRSQVYSQEIAGPAANRDGVDYFLFETRNEPCPTTLPDCTAGNIKGYSQYYGSAAAVLLRATGVPARMVAGWASGEYVESEGSFVVRDRDRHGWTQVYFPGYGWIDIEVTPGHSLDQRGQEVATSPAPDITRLIGGLSFDEDLLLRDIQETEAAERELLSLLSAGSAGGGFTVPVGVYYGLAALVVLVIFMYGAWNIAHAGLDPATRAYTKMVRAGWLLGLRRTKDLTPGEYAVRIGGIAPRAAGEALAISSQYARLLYANRKPERSELSEMNRAWGKVFRGMVGYRIGRVSLRIGNHRRRRE